MSARNQSLLDPSALCDLDAEVYPSSSTRRALVHHERGTRAGRFWADRVATYQELADIIDASADVTETWSGMSVPAGRPLPWGSKAAQLHAMLRPEEFGLPGAVEAFWRSLLAEGDRGQERHDPFVIGFLDGTLSAWIWRHKDSDYVPLPE